MASRGHDLMEQAEKRQKAWFGSRKNEEASDLYVRAASTFRMDKNWIEAAICLERAGDCEMKAKNKSDSARLYSEAAMTLKKTNLDEMERLMNKSVDIFDDEGKLNFAAKSMKSLAEVFYEGGHLEKALESYQMATNYFLGEESPAQSVQCSVRVGEIAASLKDYEKAVETFEETAKLALQNHLLKFSATEYLFKAGLCILCLGDVTNAKLSIEKYSDMYADFQDTREEQLLLSVLDSCESGDVEDFTTAVRRFDKISKLDPWKTEVLLAIKKIVEGDEKIL